MQPRDSLLFTPVEAAVLTQLSLKAVNNAIDKGTIPDAGGAARLLDLPALMSLTLERRLADRFFPGLRRQVFEALASAPRRMVATRSSEALASACT